MRYVAITSSLPLVFLFVSAFAFAPACSDDPSSGPVTQADAGQGLDAAVPSTCPTPAGAGTPHDASPTADETWTAAASPHVIGTSLSIAAGTTITIEPCATVRMKSGTGMVIEGKLLALGAADKPIRLERDDAAAAWGTIEARKGAELRFAHATIEGGGTSLAMLDIRGDQDAATQPTLFVDNVTVKGSGALGILVREGGGFAAGSQALTITGGAGSPISIWGRAVGTLPSGNYAGNAADEVIIPAMGGRDDIKEDTTLAALDVPYRIGGPDGGKALNVAGNGSSPALTIAAGAKLRFEKEVRLEVENGALRVEGTADKPVVFESAAATPAAGDWVGIVFQGTLDARNAITYAKISHAGGDSQISSYSCPGPSGGFGNEGAILLIDGKPATAFVTNTTIDSSAGDGIVRGWTGEPVDLLPTNTFTNVAGCQQSFPKPAAGVCPDPAPCPK